MLVPIQSMLTNVYNLAKYINTHGNLPCSCTSTKF